MSSLKPEIVGSFRIRRGEIFSEIEKSRIHTSALWERIKKEDTFDFDPLRGLYKISDVEDCAFPLCQYLLSKKKELRLSEILGPNVRIVTDRNVLKNLLFNVIRPDAMEKKVYACERFGNVIFIKEIVGRAYNKPEYVYLDHRKHFFRGDDLPGCVGSTPVEEFKFPDVGRAYGILSLKLGKSRVLYNCPVSQFAPDGESVESTICENSLECSYDAWHSLMLKAVTSGYTHHTVFKIKDKKAQVEFRDVEGNLKRDPGFHQGLETTLKLLLDQRLLAFLADRRCCIATLQRQPELRLRPKDIPPTYKSFLSSEFFTRFFDDED